MKLKQGKNKYFISFYPDEEAQGGALRQILIVESTLDTALRKAQKKGYELKAKSFVLFQAAMPRVWLTGYKEN